MSGGMLPENVRYLFASADRHLPARPTWLCHACGEPWPCLPYRDRLIETMNSMERGVLMAGHLGAAMADLDVPISALSERFLGWVRDPR